MKRFIFPLLVVAFVLTGLQTSYMRRDLFHTDQSIFIDLAYGFSKCQSSVKLIPPVHIALASKSETHPLAPYFFSFLTGNFKLLYPLGKLLNLFWGLLTLLVLNRVVKKHCGEIAGLTAAFCLATNLFYRYNCVQLTSEPLLLLFFILWIDYSVACIGAADDCMSPWCLAGAMAGFAYLAKPNAILLPIVFAMAFLVKRKRPAVLPFLSFYICFLIIVAPLLVARARQGEFPLYNANFNTVFAMTVDDYDDAHDIPFIAQRGLLDNMKRAVKFNHLKKYLFHIPVFFKYLVNRLFNRILPGPIPGVFWLTVACYLLWLFANSEQTRNVAPFIVVFFILYCIALIPVTINNDSARFFFPLQVCLYFVFGHLVDRKFGEQAVPILLLVTLSYFLVVPIPSMLAGPFGNPLEATDASIEIVEDWLSKQSSPLIVYYTFTKSGG